MPKWMVVVFGCSLIGLPPALGQERQSAPRTWTDQSGRSLEASFVRAEAGQVLLKMPDGRVVPVPFERLSEADQEVAKRLHGLNPVAIAAQIDRLVDKKLSEHQVKPNPMTTDEQFVRRVYLEITGTIPTFDQTIDFLESKERNKRQRLIDRLLASEGYVSHSFNWFADLLRVVSRTNDFFIFEHYIEWIKQAVRENMPYDVFVTKLLTAEGHLWDDPATGYFLRDRGMPLGNLSSTVSTFLGTEISCAECHDHPFEDWSQMDFYSLAAFLGQRQDNLNMKGRSTLVGKERIRIEEEQRKADPSLGPDGFVQPFRLAITANEHSIWDDPEMKLTLPHDYAYKDGKPGDVVVPRVLFDPPADLAAHSKPRQAFAGWLTSKENPRFAKTIANRLWKRAFGLGLVEPLDDIRDGKHAANPELLAFLEQMIKDQDFDVREFLRAVYYSQSWQRSASLDGPGLAEIDGNKHLFPGPLLKRMTANQLWDSFLTLAVPDPLRHTRRVAADLSEFMDFDITKVSGEESFARTQGLSQIVARTIGGGSAPSLDAWIADSNATDPVDGSYLKFASSYMLRASELAQPAAPSHFLRAWGQGDRALTDGATDNGSIPQILTMINGPFTQMLVKPDSLIFKNAGSERGTGDKMEKIYLSILNRYPQGREKSICIKSIRAGDEGYGDLIWALVNTREFIFIR
jgi:hypothetical protein